MLTVLSFGGGQDSTAILLKCIYDGNFRKKYVEGELIVIMADTGNEHPQTVLHVRQMQALCKRVEIPFYYLTPDLGYHKPGWHSLKEQYHTNHSCGSKAFNKSCTDNLKIRVIYRFLEEYIGKKYGVPYGRKKAFYWYAENYGELPVMIGIAAGEEKRMAKPDDPNVPVWMRKCLERKYPLVELAWDRRKCQDYIKNCGFTVPVPSNCMLCPYMDEIELLHLYRFHPEEYQEWVVIEQKKIDHYAGKEKNFGVWGRKLLPEVLAGAEKKYGHWTNHQLAEYRMSHGHCVASKY